MATLDRSRPFGTIWGIIENNAAYEQDGKLFDIDGNQVFLDGQPTEETPVETLEFEAEVKEQTKVSKTKTSKAAAENADSLI